MRIIYKFILSVFSEVLQFFGDDPSTSGNYFSFNDIMQSRCRSSVSFLKPNTVIFY